MLDVILLKFFFQKMPLPLPTHAVNLTDSTGQAILQTNLGTVILETEKGTVTLQSDSD